MKSNDNNPDPIGSPLRAYASTLNLLARLAPKSVLDCPAGRGAFSKRLIDAGYDTTCCDIEPAAFEVSGLESDFGDMNKALPYEDARFDAITCLNGLQRVWARGRAIREFERVLKPGGHVILTFVNNANLIHRLSYFMSGSVIHNTVGPPYVCDPEAEEPASSYRYPMTIAHVASAVKSVGLEWSGMETVGLSKASLLLAPLAPLPMVTRFLAPARYRNACFMEQSSSPANLFGDYLLVWARKPG